MLAPYVSPHLLHTIVGSNHLTLQLHLQYRGVRHLDEGVTPAHALAVVRREDGLFTDETGRIRMPADLTLDRCSFCHNGTPAFAG